MDENYFRNRVHRFVAKPVRDPIHEIQKRLWSDRRTNMLPPIKGVFEFNEVPKKKKVHNILHMIDSLSDQVLIDRELGIHPGK